MLFIQKSQELLPLHATFQSPYWYSNCMILFTIFTQSVFSEKFHESALFCSAFFTAFATAAFKTIFSKLHFPLSFRLAVYAYISAVSQFSGNTCPALAGCSLLGIFNHIDISYSNSPMILPFWIICFSAFFKKFLFIELALIFISQSRE